MAKQSKKEAPEMHPLEPSDAAKIRELNGKTHLIQENVGSKQVEIIRIQEEQYRAVEQLDGVRAEMNELASKFVEKYGAKSINVLDGTYEKMSGPELTASLENIAKQKEAVEAAKKEAEVKDV